MSDFQVNTLKDRPDLFGRLQRLNRQSWPDFFVYGDTFSWDRLYAELSDFLLLLTSKDDLLIGGGFAVPGLWNGSLEDLPASIEEIIVSGLENKREAANTLMMKI